MSDDEFDIFFSFAGGAGRRVLAPRSSPSLWLRHVQVQPFNMEYRRNIQHEIPSYFVIFAAFKESVTLNLAQRSFNYKVINFGTCRKRVYISYGQ